MAPGRLGAYWPWHGLPAPRHPSPVAGFPATLVYALGTSSLFLLYVRLYARAKEAVPRPLYEFFVFEIPQLTADPLRAFVNVFTSVWPSYHWIQLAYVLGLLAIFGVAFERREGSRRAILVFYASSVGGALLGALLLHVLRSTMDAAWIDSAWNDQWTGGSCGAFGLMGAVAARARNPWPLLALYLVWEINVEWFHLRNYTPVFHLFSLAIGFVLARYVLKPHPAAAVESAPAASAT